MPTDVLFPVLIALGCAALVLAVHLATRQKPTRHDITMPDQSRRRRRHRRARAQIVQRSPLPVEAEATADALLDWHIRHEAAITRLIREGDRLELGDLDQTGLAANGTAGSLEEAMTSHPAPEMRAELAAFRASTGAMRDALQRNDKQAHDRHRGVYLEYRKAWLERLWQFPVDRPAIATLRNRSIES